MSNDIKKYRQIIESAEHSVENHEPLMELKIFNKVKDKIQKLQKELSQEKNAGLKKGEYVSSVDLSKFLARWVEQGRDDYFIHIKPGEEQPFINELSELGFTHETVSSDTGSKEVIHRKDKKYNAIFSHMIIVDSNKLFKINNVQKDHPNMLGAVLILVDEQNYVYVYVKGIKNLDTNEDYNDEFVVLDSDLPPLKRRNYK